MLEELLAYNKAFVEQKDYEPFLTDKYPHRKLAVVTCMDTRLSELLPAALGLKNGDAKMIRCAGAVIDDPYGTEVRSLLLAVYDMGVTDILVIGHTDCGLQKSNGVRFVANIRARGIPETAIEAARSSGICLEAWLNGFPRVEDAVGGTVALLKRHPLMPKDVSITGLIIHSETGALRPLASEA